MIPYLGGTLPESLGNRLGVPPNRVQGWNQNHPGGKPWAYWTGGGNGAGGSGWYSGNGGRGSEATLAYNSYIGGCVQFTGNAGHNSEMTIGTVRVNTNLSPVTYAGIFANVFTVSGQMVSEAGTVAPMQVNANNLQNSNGGVSTTIGPTLAFDGEPFFVAFSYYQGGLINGVRVNLRGGQLYTVTGTTGTAAAADNFSSIFIGDHWNGIQNTAMQISALMKSNTFVNMYDLQQWAADPWSYWFPQPDSAVVGIQQIVATARSNKLMLMGAGQS